MRKYFYIFKVQLNTLDIPSLKKVYFALVVLVQSILMYGLILWGSAYKNVIEPFKITHRMIIGVLMKNYNINTNCSTNDLFSKIKILTLEQLYDKRSTTKVLMNKTEYEYQNKYNTRGENSGNLRLAKPNTT